MSLIRIDCYLSMGCAAEEALRKNIGKAAELAGIQIQLSIERISDEEAQSRGFRGSPTIYMNDVELAPSGVNGFT